MDKQNVAHTYNEVLFSLNNEGKKKKNEENTDTGYNVDETWRRYAQWNKPETKGQILYDYIYMTYLEKSN